MKFSAQLPTHRADAPDEFCSAAALAKFARACEAAGFAAAYVTDHPFPTDAWLKAGGHHALDPFVALSAAAAATQHLRLHTNILVLPYRNPFLTAKALASLDVLSGGRVIAGVAAGYLEGEARALGADFARRNALCDAAIPAMQAAWRGDTVRCRGPAGAYEAAGNAMLPRPVQRPHPPLWMGGNSALAMRRAAKHAQGWSPFPLPRRARAATRTAALETPAQLAAAIARLQRLAAEVGRAPLDVNFVPFSRGMNHAQPLHADAMLEEVRRLQKAGCTWLSIGMPDGSAGAYLDAVAEFGARVIAPLRGAAETPAR